MKDGDLVKLCSLGYPQHKGKIGMLIEQVELLGRWIVMIGGVLHPYVVDERDMELRDESR
jgi:hypothetical protein